MFRKLEQKVENEGHFQKILRAFSTEFLVIFRPYFIWERKIFKSNGFFFFTKFAKILFIFKFKGVTHRIQPT